MTQPEQQLAGTGEAQWVTSVQQLPATAAWIPEIPAKPFPNDLTELRDYLRRQRPHQSFEICCEDTSAATRVVSMNRPSNRPDSPATTPPALLLRTPPAAELDVPLVAALASAVPQLTVAVDHFLHGELLSRAANMAGRVIAVLTALDTGHQLMGVHPGPDCDALSRALARQPGLRLRGLFADMEPEIAEGGARKRPCGRVPDLARSCLRQLQSGGLPGTDVVLGVSAEDLLTAAKQVDGCMVVWSPLAECYREFSAAIPGPESATARVRVISRPALEYCIIGAGGRSGLITSGTRVLEPAGAVISGWSAHHARLDLSGEAVDLRIGSEVTLGNFRKHT